MDLGAANGLKMEMGVLFFFGLTVVWHTHFYSYFDIFTNSRSVLLTLNFSDPVILVLWGT